MINNRSILPQNRTELDIQSPKLTSAACSFVIFQSQMHWLSAIWLFCSKPLLGSRNTFASIHKSGNFISTFKNKTGTETANQLVKYQPNYFPRICLIFCVLWSTLKPLIFDNPLYNPVKCFINTLLDVRCKTLSSLSCRQGYRDIAKYDVLCRIIHWRSGRTRTRLWSMTLF